MSLRTPVMASRLSSAFPGSPGSNIYWILDTVAAELDAVDSAADGLPASQYICTATGQSLNNIAAGFGLTRLAGESDPMLAARLNATLLLKRSCGTVSDILAVVTSITGVPASNVTITETPAAFSLQFYGQIQQPFSLDTLNSCILQQKAQGIAFLVAQTSFLLDMMPTEAGMTASSYWTRCATPGGWGWNWCCEPWGGMVIGTNMKLTSMSALQAVMTGNGWGMQWGANCWGGLCAGVNIPAFGTWTPVQYLRSDPDGWGNSWGTMPWGGLNAGLAVVWPFYLSAFLTSDSGTKATGGTSLVSLFCSLPTYWTSNGWGQSWGSSNLWGGLISGTKMLLTTITGLAMPLVQTANGWGQVWCGQNYWGGLVGGTKMSLTQITAIIQSFGWGQSWGATWGM
jgi:hypothetical protein